VTSVSKVKERQSAEQQRHVRHRRQHDLHVIGALYSWYSHVAPWAHRECAPLNSPVRMLTEALEHGTHAARAAKHTAFMAEAVGPWPLLAPASSAASVADAGQE